MWGDRKEVPSSRGVLSFIASFLAFSCFNSFIHFSFKLLSLPLYLDIYFHTEEHTCPSSAHAASFQNQVSFSQVGSLSHCLFLPKRTFKVLLSSWPNKLTVLVTLAFSFLCS